MAEFRHFPEQIRNAALENMQPDEEVRMCLIAGTEVIFHRRHTSRTRRSSVWVAMLSAVATIIVEKCSAKFRTVIAIECASGAEGSSRSLGRSDPIPPCVDPGWQAAQRTRPAVRMKAIRNRRRADGLKTK